MFEIILLSLAYVLVITSIVLSIVWLLKERKKRELNEEVQDKMNPLAEEKKEDELFAFRQLFGGEIE